MSKPKNAINEYMSEIGSSGGKKRWENTADKKRSEEMRKLANKRWNMRKKHTTTLAERKARREASLLQNHLRAPMIKKLRRLQRIRK